MSNAHVVKRGNNYYFRFQVPTDLADKIDLFCLYKSLRTFDKSTARLISRKYEQETGKVFSLLRAGVMTAEEANDQLAAIFRRNNGNDAKTVAEGISLAALAARFMLDRSPGIPCLSVAAGHDKKLKTLSSERLMPIHLHID